MGRVVGKHTCKPRHRATTIRVDHLIEWKLGNLAAFIDGEGGIQITRSKRNGRRYQLSLHPVVYFTHQSGGDYNSQELGRCRCYRGITQQHEDLPRRSRPSHDEHPKHHAPDERCLSEPYREEGACGFAILWKQALERGPEGRRYNKRELKLYREIRRANLRNRGRIHANTRIPYEGRKSEVPDSQAGRQAEGE